MKKLLLVLFSLILFGCSSNYKTVNVETVYKAINDNSDVVILDVRTLEEYNEEHIPNAVNIPIDDIDTIDIEKDKTIYVYCASGNRSKMATNKLIDMGYTDVYNMGGINNYPYELEK